MSFVSPFYLRRQWAHLSQWHALKSSVRYDGGGLRCNHSDLWDNIYGFVVFKIADSSGSWLIHSALSKTEGQKDDRVKVDQIETLELQNVQFAYPARPEIQVLQGISLTINKVGSTGLHLPFQKPYHIQFHQRSTRWYVTVQIHLHLKFGSMQVNRLLWQCLPVLCAGPKGCLRRGVWQWKEHHYGLAGAFLWSHCWGRIGEQSRPQEQRKKKQWNCIWHPDWFGFQQRFHSQQGARPKDGFFFTTSQHITARHMEGIWISSPTASRLDMLARRDQDHMLSVKREYHFIGSTSRFMSCTRTSQGAGSLRHQRPSEYHAGMQWSHRGGRCVAWISCLQRSVLQMWMPPKIWRSFYLAVDTSHFFLLRQKPRHFHVKAVSIALADGTINFTQDLKAAAKNAQLDFIQNLPQQFDTYVGSGGLLCSTKWVCKKTAGETHDVKLRLHLFLSTNHICFGSTDSLSIFYVSVCFSWLEPKVSVLWWSKAAHCNC